MIKSLEMMKLFYRHRVALWATFLIELQKKYSGSVLGKLWLVLYPLLLLSVYLFVYLVVFKMRFPGYSEFNYVMYVFCGLIPYLGFSEALTTGCHSIKQNMHLLKNVIIPIELVAIRSVAMSLASQVISMGILLGLLGFSGYLSWNIFWIPLIFIFKFFL